MTPKYPQFLHPPKVLFFLKNPKNIEIQNFDPPPHTHTQSAQAYVYMKISEFPTWEVAKLDYKQKSTQQAL